MENFVRSAMAPDTIVAAVAQNTVWNMRNPSVGRPLSMKERSKKWGIPMNPPAPNINPKPINQYSKEPNMKSTKFFIRMLAVFFTLVKPASTNANPGCMKNTSIAASNIHTVFNPRANSPTVSGAADASSAGAVTTSVIVSVTAATVSAAAVFCADISVVKQHKMNIVVAIHSFTKLWLLYFVSIIIILFYTYYLLVML